MANYSIRFSKVENSIEVLSHYAVQLNQVRGEVSSARRNLLWLGSSTYRINYVLLNIEKSIMNDALKMRSLSGALSRISSYYRSTESRITSGSAQSMKDAKASEDVSDFGEWFANLKSKIRELFVSWGIIKAKKQVRTPGEAVTSAQEKEMDRYMKNEISQILKKDRYSEKTWKKASVEERKEILNEYLQEVAGVLGLEIGEINYTYSASSNGYYNMGSYVHSQNTVNINEWVLENGGKNGVADSYSLMSTIVHEMRHAYQYAACEHPEQFVVTEETIQSWQDSITNYRSKSGFMREGMGEREAYQAYRDQTIEVDARWFAGQDS